MRFFRRVVLFALAVCAAGLVHGTRAESPEETFGHGNELYVSGDFNGAAEAYRTVVQYGIVDPRVEYNLGNAAFRLGRMGEAILHYRRAQRLAPADPDIAANLELALSRSLDRADPPELTGPVRIVRAVQDRLGPDRQAIALLALLWVVAGLATWRSSRPRGWNAAAGWTLAALLFVGSIASVSWYTTWQRLDGEHLAVILKPSVEVLAGAGQNNATLFTVHEGLTVIVQQEQREWLQVTLPNGLHGWVPRDALGIV